MTGSSNRSATKACCSDFHLRRSAHERRSIVSALTVRGFLIVAAPRLLIACLVASATSVQAPAALASQTCNAASLGLTFHLPSDWACAVGGRTGVRYGALAPGRVAELRVYTTTVPGGVQIARYSVSLVAGVRQQYSRAGSGLSIQTARTTIGSGVPAFLITVSYHGVWMEGAGEEGTIKHVIYFFVRRNLLFEFDYSGVTPWVKKDAQIFTNSAKSIRVGRTAWQACSGSITSPLGFVRL
jgi:hypothetical protein